MQTLKILSCAVLSTLAYAAHPKISHDLDEVDRNSAVNVIVQFVQTPGEFEHNKVISRRGTFRRDLGLVKGGAYSIPAIMLEDLASDPQVAFISPDRPVQGTLDSTTAAVNAAAAWNSNLTGAGIGVAVIDSGINDDADLPLSRIVYTQSWVNNDWHDYYGCLLYTSDAADE